MKRSTLTAMLLAATLAAGAALAQHAQVPHGGHGARPAAPAEPASTRELRAANDAMHKAMDIRFTGRADRDFIAGMIPHHEGAIAMAQVVLRHGTNPEVKQLAHAIIAAQQKEIAWMREWLARNP
jgi:uncharacterized protein (DUF305 family)